MDKPMTTADLFDKICEILKKEEVYPDILDYALPKHNPAPIWIVIYTDDEPQTSQKN